MQKIYIFICLSKIIPFVVDFQLFACLITFLRMIYFTLENSVCVLGPVVIMSYLPGSQIQYLLNSIYGRNKLLNCYWCIKPLNK